MPIKTTGTPWLFIPNFSTRAKCLLMIELDAMLRFFLTCACRDCPSNSYIWTYMRNIAEEIKVNVKDVDEVIEQLNNTNHNHSTLLVALNKELTSSRQRQYCRDIINRMTLAINNETLGAIKYLLDDFIDNEVEKILR